MDKILYCALNLIHCIYFYVCDNDDDDYEESEKLVGGINNVYNTTDTEY
jgi:hypothetical protein